MNDTLKVYDNGGETLDRYTVLRPDWPEHSGVVQAFGMDANACGFAMHCSAVDGPHLGKRISWDELPEPCRRAAEHFLTTNQNEDIS